MYDRSLHDRRKHFCCYCLHSFITEEILKRDIKDWFKINGKQTIKMPKKRDCVKFKTFERSFIIQMTFILTIIKNMFLVVMAIR